MFVCMFRILMCPRLLDPVSLIPIHIHIIDLYCLPDSRFFKYPSSLYVWVHANGQGALTLNHTSMDMETFGNILLDTFSCLSSNIQSPILLFIASCHHRSMSYLTILERGVWCTLHIMRKMPSSTRPSR